MDRKAFAAIAAAAAIGLSANSIAAGNQPPQPATRNTAPKPATRMPAPRTVPPRPATRAAAVPPPYPATGNAPAATPRPGTLTQPEQGPQAKVLKRNSLTIANVLVPGNITYKTARLALNGAGEHKTWFFFEKYIAALYLTNPTHIAAVAVAAKQPKAISLTMLADMSREDFVGALNDGFKQNEPGGGGAELNAKWNRFKTFFTDLKAHDKVVIGYIPGQGTGVTINGQPRGAVRGAKFNRAVMGMWLGDDPIDGALKDKLIGRSQR